MNIHKILPFLLVLIWPFTVSAQGNESGFEMADVLHRNGKIYLVVFVLLTIFAGVLTMLIRLEKRLSRWEKEKQNQFNS